MTARSQLTEEERVAAAVEAHAAVVNAHIKAIVDAAPPFTPEQRRKLAALWGTSKTLLPPRDVA